VWPETRQSERFPRYVEPGNWHRDTKTGEVLRHRLGGRDLDELSDRERWELAQDCAARVPDVELREALARQTATAG
jgi:hypothetical protein